MIAAFSELVRALPGNARFVAVTLLSAFAVLLLVTTTRAWQWYAEGSDRLAYTDPRYARLAGLDQNIEQLREGSQKAAQQLAALAFPASEDPSSLGASAQQQLRRLLEEAGLQVSGSQLLAPRPQDGFEELRLELRASGPVEALDRMLLSLQQARPLVLVRAIDVAPTRNRRNQESRDVNVELSVSMVRLQ